MPAFHLFKQLRQLTVSIGGYDARLPVFIDNTSAGNVSMSTPLILMVSEGSHKVKVCVGVYCENETVDIRFAQPIMVNFGDRLKKDVAFSAPTVRIADSLLTGNSMEVDVEFINPDTTDHVLNATIGCGYSNLDPRNLERHNNFVQSQITKTVKAGDQVTQHVTFSLTGGSAVIANEPSVVDESVT